MNRPPWWPQWPFTSRLAYETAVSERDRLREQNAALLETVLSFARQSVLLGPAPERRTEATDQLPPEVWALIRAWENPVTQKQLEQRAREGYRHTRSWDAVLEMLRLPAEEVVV